MVAEICRGSRIFWMLP